MTVSRREIPSQRSLARSFTRRRFLLPVPGVTSLVFHRRPVISGHSTRYRSASFDTNITPTIASAASPTHFFKIENIRAGQLVLASNPATGQLEPRRVLQTFRRTTHHLRHLTFQSATGARQTIETTDEHPFWSQSEFRWRPAGDLQPGDRVIDPHGAQSLLVTTYREPHPEGVTVFNFEVEGFHSYFVAARGPGGQPVLVHNAEGYGGKRNAAANTWEKRRSAGKRYEEFVNKEYYGGIPEKQTGFRTDLGKRFLDNIVKDGVEIVGVENKYLAAKNGAVNTGVYRNTKLRTKLAETLRRIRTQARKDQGLLNSEVDGTPDRIEWNLGRNTQSYRAGSSRLEFASASVRLIGNFSRRQEGIMTYVAFRNVLDHLRPLRYSRATRRDIARYLNSSITTLNCDSSNDMCMNVSKTNRLGTFCPHS